MLHISLNIYIYSLSIYAYIDPICKHTHMQIYTHTIMHIYTVEIFRIPSTLVFPLPSKYVYATRYRSFAAQFRWITKILLPENCWMYLMNVGLLTSEIAWKISYHVQLLLTTAYLSFHIVGQPMIYLITK